MTESMGAMAKWVTGLSQGQIYALVFAPIFGLVSQLGINADVMGVKFTMEAENSFLEGAAITFFVVGTAMHIYRTYKQGQKEEREEKRREQRPLKIPSGKTQDFLKLITRPMTQAEVSTIPFEPDDSLTEEQAKAKLKIYRASGGADIGAEIYYNGSHFVPRNVTVIDEL